MNIIFSAIQYQYCIEATPLTPADQHCMVRPSGQYYSYYELSQLLGEFFINTVKSKYTTDGSTENKKRNNSTESKIQLTSSAVPSTISFISYRQTNYIHVTPLLQLNQHVITGLHDHMVPKYNCPGSTSDFRTKICSHGQTTTTMNQTTKNAIN